MPGLIDTHNHLANYALNLLPGIDPSSLDYTGISECLEKFIWPRLYVGLRREHL